MKNLVFVLCLMLVFALLASCERPDYNDEIKDTYRTAKEDSRSDVVIEGNLWSRMADDGLKWEEAVSYCENLDEFGYSDWGICLRSTNSELWSVTVL